MQSAARIKRHTGGPKNFRVLSRPSCLPTKVVTWLSFLVAEEVCLCTASCLALATTSGGTTIVLPLLPSLRIRGTNFVPSTEARADKAPSTDLQMAVCDFAGHRINSIP